MASVIKVKCHLAVRFPKVVRCPKCGAIKEIRTYRKFVVCPECAYRFPFEGFGTPNYPDFSSSMLTNVKAVADCPACRGKHMLLGPSGRLWKCMDCGFRISKKKMKHGVFWFCDDCDAFLNVQPGFDETGKTWVCSECDFKNDITKNNIF